MKFLLPFVAMLLATVSGLAQGIRVQAFTTNSGPVVSNIVTIISSNLAPNRLRATNTVTGLRVYAATNGLGGFWLDPSTIQPGAATNVYQTVSSPSISVATNTSDLTFTPSLSSAVTNQWKIDATNAAQSGPFVRNLTGRATNMASVLLRTNIHGPTYWTGFGQPADTMTSASDGAGNVTGDSVQYRVTYYGASGESLASKASPPGGYENEAIVVSSIPVSSDPFAVGRKVYRNKSATPYQFFLVTNIANNVTTAIQDNLADGSLGAEISSTESDAPYLYKNGVPYFNWERYHVFSESDSQTDGLRWRFKTPDGMELFQYRGHGELTNVIGRILYIGNPGDPSNSLSAISYQVGDITENSGFNAYPQPRVTWHFGTNTGKAYRLWRDYFTFGTSDQMMILSTSNGVMNFGGTNLTRISGTNVLIPTYNYSTAEEANTVHIGSDTNYLKIHTNRVVLTGPLNQSGGSASFANNVTVIGNTYFKDTGAYARGDNVGLDTTLTFGASAEDVFVIQNYIIEDESTNIGVLLIQGNYIGDGSGLTNILPAALPANNSPSAGLVPAYVNATTWTWTSGGGGSATNAIANLNGIGTNTFITSNLVMVSYFPANGVSNFWGWNAGYTNLILSLTNRLGGSATIYDRMLDISPGGVFSVQGFAGASPLLSNLNASFIASGTLAPARMATNAAVANDILAATSASTAAWTNQINIASATFTTAIGDGYGITNLISTNIVYQTNAGATAVIALRNDVSLITTNNNLMFTDVSGVVGTEYRFQQVFVTNSAGSTVSLAIPAWWQTPDGLRTYYVTNGSRSKFLVEVYGAALTNFSYVPLW